MYRLTSRRIMPSACSVRVQARANFWGADYMLGRFIVVIAMLAVIGSAAGEDSDVKAGQTDWAAMELWDLFRLCPHEEHMRIVVQELPDHARRAGLTIAQIRNAVESRLRGARIYNENSRSFVHVRLILGEPTTGSQYFDLYGITLEYSQLLSAIPLDLAFPVPTWSTSSIGKGDVASILGYLGLGVDKFLVEYLRVRDSEACQEFRRQPTSFDRLKSLH